MTCPPVAPNMKMKFTSSQYPEFPNKHASQKKNQSTEIRRRAEFTDWSPAWCSLGLVLKEKRSNSHELCFKRRGYFLADHQNLQQKNCYIHNLTEFQHITIPANAIVVDALLGSGLNRPVSGIVAQYVDFLNKMPNRRIAIDIPSGLFADVQQNSDATIFKADKTYTFNSPKLQFLFAENSQYVGSIQILDILLQHPFNENETPYRYVEAKDIHIKKRDAFSHKGTFGHALLVAGSHGKVGAAVLASKACLRTGCGLLTTHVPSCGYDILQTAVPEAMTDTDKNFEKIFHR